MTEQEFRGANSETAKYRHLTTEFCYRADGQIEFLGRIDDQVGNRVRHAEKGV